MREREKSICYPESRAMGCYGLIEWIATGTAENYGARVHRVASCVELMNASVVHDRACTLNSEY